MKFSTFTLLVLAILVLGASAILVTQTIPPTAAEPIITANLEEDPELDDPCIGEPADFPLILREKEETPATIASFADRVPCGKNEVTYTTVCNELKETSVTTHACASVGCWGKTVEIPNARTATMTSVWGDTECKDKDCQLFCKSGKIAFSKTVTINDWINIGNDLSCVSGTPKTMPASCAGISGFGLATMGEGKKRCTFVSVSASGTCSTSGTVTCGSGTEAKSCEPTVTAAPIPPQCLSDLRTQLIAEGKCKVLDTTKKV